MRSAYPTLLDSRQVQYSILGLFLLDLYLGVYGRLGVGVLDLYLGVYDRVGLGLLDIQHSLAVAKYVMLCLIWRDSANNDEQNWIDM